MPTKTEEYARPATPPDSPSLTTVREAAENCTACHLYKRATQTVFGEGPKKPAMMLVGEQPGDYEDVAGKPFVGPAGKIMDRALEEAGIDRKKFTSRMRSNISNGSRAVNAASIRTKLTRGRRLSPVA
jgi:hypothetical protein